MKLESDAAKAAFIVKHFSAFPPKTFRALSTSDRKELFQFFLRLAPTPTSEFHNICFQGNTRLFFLLEGLLHFKNAVSVVFVYIIKRHWFLCLFHSLLRFPSCFMWISHQQSMTVVVAMSTVSVASSKSTTLCLMK